MKLWRAPCPQCGRQMAILVPKHGDGTALVYRRHGAKPGIIGSGNPVCLESRQEVRVELVNKAEDEARGQAAHKAKDKNV